MSELGNNKTAVVDKLFAALGALRRRTILHLGEPRGGEFFAGVYTARTHAAHTLQERQKRVKIHQILFALSVPFFASIAYEIDSIEWSFRLRKKP